ncbi:ATP synthase F1 subunit epsilon [Ruminococcus sp. HUN007]|jgi:F-type H+-transporting ATPase subunit epsilon|uniref:ATP synthase F1 subunit epsilon n=1 Tax=Ruminococcus sp. HUN007 TaxID=1514668 RepID=UPI0005D232EA|nr:ATP synthase F1 subunit epsilon [Ruminococcus sp. HUN007]
MASFRLQIITPDRIFYDDEAERLIVRTTDGEMGVLARHENFVGALPSGPVRIMKDGKYRVAALSSGVLKVSAEKTTIIAEAVEWADEIDIEWANRSAEEAREKIAKKESEKEMLYAELKLKRALNRINVHSGNIR